MNVAIKQISLAVLLVLGMAACGSKDANSDTSTPTNSTTSDSGGASAGVDSDGNCTSTFISDYDTVYWAAQSVYNVDDLNKTRGLAVQFKEKYKGVTCRASLKADGSLNGSATQFNVDERMDTLIAAIDNALQSK